MTVRSATSRRTSSTPVSGAVTAPLTRRAVRARAASVRLGSGLSSSTLTSRPAARNFLAQT